MFSLFRARLPSLKSMEKETGKIKDGEEGRKKRDRKEWGNMRNMKNAMYSCHEGLSRHAGFGQWDALLQETSGRVLTPLAFHSPPQMPHCWAIVSAG